MSSIYYIEDIDSLRFALSVYDQYDIGLLQPHFPGYPIFCFLASTIYFFTNSLAITFSIIGGLSSFFIIYFSILLTKFKGPSYEYYFLILILLINPMLWIMSNRYMPDLMGLSIFVASFYYLTSKDNNSKYLGGFLLGLMLGVRLSYFPLLLLPVCILFFQNNFKTNLFFISSITLGCIIWLLPLIWITGYENLFNLANIQTVGHFTDFGGTFLTEDSWKNRAIYFMHTIWGDGLGGYWMGRSHVTLLLSVFLVINIFTSFNYLRTNLWNSNRLKILIISMLLYALWAFCFQNIIYKSRHVMPIVYLIILLFPYGLKSISNNKYYKSVIILFLASLLFVSTNLALQHKQPTAIAKLRDSLINTDKHSLLIINPLINYYLKSTGLNINFIDIDLKQVEINLNLKKNYKDIYMVGDYHSFIDENKTISLDSVFYHNPYVNRMWSTINLYKVEI